MRIYIPSRSRAHITQTYVNLPPALQRRVLYVVPKSELKDYINAGFPAVSPPPSVDRIAVTRQWIVEYHLKHYTKVTDKLVMLDDDLRFYYRSTLQPNGFCGAMSGSNPNPQKVLDGFKHLEKLLDTYAHGGILIQLGANRYEDSPKPMLNSRVCRAIAFRASILRKHWPLTKFGPVPVQDDFHATLTLMKLGYENAIVTELTQEQTGGSGSAGGASTYRDMAYHAASVHTLKKLHPDFVKVVEKETKTAWKGEARIDVVIAWKKAIAHGIERCGLQVVRKSK